MYPLAHTTLLLATPAQKRTIWRSWWEHWYQPNGMSLEVAEHYFTKADNFEACLEGRATYWALVNRSETEQDDVLSSLRTIRRNSKVLEDGQVRDATSYVITSVVTPSHHRKKGYATHMLSLLHYALAIPSPTLPPFPEQEFGQPPAPEHAPRDATYSTLWSDVGRDFYRTIRIGRGEGSREGWVVGADQEVRYELSPAKENVVDTSLPEGWQSFPSVSDIPSDLLATLSLHTLTTAQQQTPAKTLAYDPPTSPGILEFSISRSLRHITAQVLERNNGPIHRVYINKTTVPPSLLVLIPIYEPDEPATLKISYLSLGSYQEAETTQHAAAADVLSLLLSRARMYSCIRIEGWQLPRPFVDAWAAWTRENGGAGSLLSHAREDHLGALAWYGRASRENVEMLGGQL
ncbi:hypothetical protein QFC21_004643 [Naganishia friedmannii]|uniref:Uncharacterized protein n=1 Tax=Naganishia friedmannii TaxID=89922 RepID=A0ACC2VEL7_9TREE|nr:hypothetical protein QFC21_004643 [Naganishia friedmannii]